MFWKKEEDKYSVNLKSSDQRSTYRYFPEEDEKVFIIISNREFEVQNISAGGTAFYADHCTGGDQYEFSLRFFEDEEPFISGSLEIIDSEGTLCRAKFINMSDETLEQIHKFVFERQLKKIRNKKLKNKENVKENP